jgi:membrane associated rhomboid family serine protease
MKAIIGANVVMFFAQLFMPSITDTLGLVPFLVTRRLWVWQLGTYMFLHGGLFHILFNMLALWMFGTELERIWGARYFVKFYFVTGIGAAMLTVLFSLLPLGVSQQLYRSNVIGASGAIYGLLLAYALYFPDRRIYMYFVFPIPTSVDLATWRLRVAGLLQAAGGIGADPGSCWCSPELHVSCPVLVLGVSDV